MSTFERTFLYTTPNKCRKQPQLYLSNFKFLATAEMLTAITLPVCIAQCTYVAWLVVFVAVGKHELKVINTLLGAKVVERLQTLLDLAHVHWIRYHLVVVLAHTYRYLYTFGLNN